MTQEQIIEGNKLIAVFMGGEIRKGKKVEVVMMDSVDGPFVAERVSNLQYHTSWDWIMPVCAKWDKLDIPDKDWIEYERLCDLLDNIITSTWDCMEAFTQLSGNIQWYNTNKNPDNG